MVGRKLFLLLCLIAVAAGDGFWNGLWERVAEAPSLVRPGRSVPKKTATVTTTTAAVPPDKGRIGQSTTTSSSVNNWNSWNTRTNSAEDGSLTAPGASTRANSSTMLRNSSVDRRLRQGSAVVCTDLVGQSAQEVIDAKCTELKTKGSNQYTLDVKGVDVGKWQTFTSTLDDVRINIQIEDPAITEVNMPVLDTVTITKFTISNNPNLQNVILKLVSMNIMQIETLEIKDNPQLTSIKIDAPKQFSGSIIISNNENLKTFELTTNKIDSTQMEISGTLVPELDFSKITEFTMKGGMVITKNSELERIKLPTTTTFFVFPKLEIREYSKLAKIESEDKLNGASATALTIRGNPVLEDALLKKLKGFNGGKNFIQEFGECLLPSPVTDLSKLSVCQLVDGDLTIAVGATGTVSSNLTEVKGNVRLGELTDNQLDFLRGTNVTGKIYSDICEFLPTGLTKAVESPPCPITPAPVVPGPVSPGGGPIILGGGPGSPVGSPRASGGPPPVAGTAVPAGSSGVSKNTVILVVASIIVLLVAVLVIIGICLLRKTKYWGRIKKKLGCGGGETKKDKNSKEKGKKSTNSLPTKKAVPLRKSAQTTIISKTSSTATATASTDEKAGEQEENNKIEEGVISKDTFTFTGPLLFRAGQSKPISHDYEGQKNISLKEVVFDNEMNKVFDIGSDQEKYELDTEDCITYIVSDSQTLVPESQLVSLISESEMKREEEKEKKKAEGKLVTEKTQQDEETTTKSKGKKKEGTGRSKKDPVKPVPNKMEAPKTAPMSTGGKKEPANIGKPAPASTAKNEPTTMAKSTTAGSVARKGTSKMVAAPNSSSAGKKQQQKTAKSRESNSMAKDPKSAGKKPPASSGGGGKKSKKEKSKGGEKKKAEKKK